MKVKTFLFFACLLFSIAACKQKAITETSAAPEVTDLYDLIANSSTKFDSVFAKSLGASEHGMHQYVMAFLKKGPNRNQDSTTAANLQKAHMDNIIRMANEGKLVLAGPFMDDGEIRGIYIFNVATVEEAEALTATDPAIQAGRLSMELHPWYGSATLPLITPLHKRLEKTSIAK